METMRCGRAGMAVLLTLVILLCGSLREARAHPHIFVESSAELVFGKMGLEGIRIRWVFDALSSSQYLMDLDTNGDGTLTKPEWVAQRDDISGFLAEEGYFLHVAVNGKRLKVPSVRDFMAFMEDGMLVYTFYAPLIIPSGCSVQIAVFDPSYYTDFATDEDEITFTDAPATLKHAVADAPELAFYEGQIIPLALRMQF